MKTTSIRWIITAIALAATANAAPFLAIGDGAELFVTGGLGIRADDNIFTDKVKVSDTIFNLTPGLELTFGKNAQIKGTVSVVDAISSYADNSQLNTNLFSADFGASYSDGKLKLNFGTGFHETNQNSVDIRGLTRRDGFSANLSGEVELSQKTSVSSAYTFSHVNFKRKNYSDSDDYVVPINFYYKWTEKLDLSVGYQYRNYQTQIGSDSEDHFFNIGARGDFSPKLSGSFTVGIVNRQLAKGSEISLLGLNANLNYELTPKTSLSVGASNSPDTSPSGQQQKNFALNGSVSSNISEQWKVNGGLSYRAINYYTRTDDYIEANLGATYVINTYFSLNGSYVHRNNSSALSSSEFTNNVFSLSTSLRY